jgi:hypothetical protein
LWIDIVPSMIFVLRLAALSAGARYVPMNFVYSAGVHSADG